MMQRGGLLGLAAGLAGVGAAAGGWSWQRRRDAAVLAADPEHAELQRPLPVEPTTVTGADGTRLHVDVAGPAASTPSAPTVVLMHGYGMSRRFWHYQVRELATDLRVVAYDHRGHGRSDLAASGDYSIAALAADLDAVLTAVTADGDMPVVVGHSMGGMTLLAWAAAHAADVSQRIAGAVLADTAMADVAEGMFGQALAITGSFGQRASRQLLAARYPLPGGSTPWASRLVKLMAMSPAAAPAHTALVERLLLDTPARVRAGLGATLGELDLRAAPAALTVPALVLVGARDRLTPPAQSRALTAALPDAELIEIPDAGHQCPLDTHQPVTAAIRRHVARSTAPAPVP
jgi:pimeloyl-ACP methyl ester carboxylesterase